MSETKRFLFNTQFSWEFTGVDRLLAAALRARGHEVAMVACGGGLPRYCEQQTSVTDRLECGDCLQRVKIEFDTYDLPSYTTRDQLTPEDIALADAMVDDQETEALLDLHYKEVPIGRMARLNLLQYFHGYPFEITGETERVFRRCVHSAILFTIAKERILDDFQPDMIIGCNGKFLQWGPFVHMAKARGLQYATWENLYFHGRNPVVIFGVDLIAHEQRVDTVWERELATPFTQENREELIDYFQRWKGGRMSMFNYYPDAMEEDARAIRKELALDEDKPIVSIFCNVSWDSASAGYDTAFESMYHWVFHAVEYAQKNPDIQLIIRAHPAEVRLPETRKTSTPICQEIRKRYTLPDNVKLVENTSAISSYTLGAMSKVVMLYTSTLGLEFAISGIKPWVAAKPYYGGKGFTVDLSGPQDMFDRLDAKQFENKLSPEQIQLAERISHMGRIRRVFPLPGLGYENGQIVFHPPGPEVYKPGGHPTIDKLCEYVLTGEYLLDIGRHPTPVSS